MPNNFLVIVLAILILPVHAENAFNSINRKVMLHNLKFIYSIVAAIYVELLHMSC